jgi:hypothetical protein
MPVRSLAIAPTPEIQPKAADLEEIAFSVHQQFVRWLQRHGLLKNETDDEFSNECPELSALEACAQGSLGVGNLVKKRSKSRSDHNDADESGFEQRAVTSTSLPAWDIGWFGRNAEARWENWPIKESKRQERLIRFPLW